VGVTPVMNASGESPARSRAPFDFTVEFTIDSNTIEPNQQELFDLKISNTGDNPDTYDLSTTGVPTNWTVKLMYNAAEVDKINIDEGKSATIQVIIIVNASGAATITVTATSANAGSKSDGIAITVGYIIQINCDNPKQYLAAGESTTFDLDIKNHQAIEDEVTLDTDTLFQVGSEPDDNEWVIAFGETIKTVPAESTETNTLTVFAPYNAVPPQKTTFKIIGTSTATSETFYSNQIEAIIKNIYNITTMIKPKTPSADPGETVNYTITITNNGNGEDRVKLTTIDNLDNWGIALTKDDEPFDIYQDELILAQGASAILKAIVTVPPKAPTGLHRLDYGISSKGNYQGNISLVTNVNQMYDLELKIYQEPNIVKLSATNYLKIVAKNIGNGQDTLTLQFPVSYLPDEWIDWNVFFHSVETSETNSDQTKTVDFGNPFSIIDEERTKFMDEKGSKPTQISITMSSGQSAYVTLGVITPQFGSWGNNSLTVFGETSNFINKITIPLEFLAIYQTSELEIVGVPTLSAQNLTVGDTLKIEVDIRNNFHVSAKNFNARLYLGGLPGEEDKIIDSEQVDDVSPNSTKSISLSWKIPENTAVGTYLLKVRLEGDIIAENNEPERNLAVSVGAKKDETEDDSLMFIIMIIIIVIIIIILLVLIMIKRGRAQPDEPESEPEPADKPYDFQTSMARPKPARPPKGKKKVRKR
jgi:uncharacterized membrane protein